MTMPQFDTIKVNDQVCSALAKQLAEAKRGNVQLVAIIAVGDDGQPNVVFAGETELLPSVNMGADMLKFTVLSQILGHNTGAGRGIIRPVGN